MGIPKGVRVLGWGMSLERPTMIKSVIPRRDRKGESDNQVQNFGHPDACGSQNRPGPGQEACSGAPGEGRRLERRSPPGVSPCFLDAERRRRGRRALSVFCLSPMTRCMHEHLTCETFVPMDVPSKKTGSRLEARCRFAAGSVRPIGRAIWTEYSAAARGTFFWLRDPRD